MGGVLAKDLIFIEETAKIRHLSDGYLDKMNNAIAEHLMHQRIGYDILLSTDESVQKWIKEQLKECAKLSDEWMYAVSKDVAIKDEKCKKRKKKWTLNLNE